MRQPSTDKFPTKWNRATGRLSPRAQAAIIVLAIASALGISHQRSERGKPRHVGRCGFRIVRRYNIVVRSATRKGRKIRLRRRAMNSRNSTRNSSSAWQKRSLRGASSFRNFSYSFRRIIAAPPSPSTLGFTVNLRYTGQGGVSLLYIEDSFVVPEFSNSTRFFIR